MHSYILSLHALQKMVKCGNPPHIGLGDPPTSIWESWPDVTDLVWPFLSSLVYRENNSVELGRIPPPCPLGKIPIFYHFFTRRAALL